MSCWETIISFQITKFNYEIINEKFDNDNVWEVIFKFSSLSTLKNIGGILSNPNLKIFNLSNNKFESILNFQIKSSFPNIILRMLKLELCSCLSLFKKGYTREITNALFGNHDSFENIDLTQL